MLTRVTGWFADVVQGDERARLLVATRDGSVVLDEAGQETPGRVLTSSPSWVATLSQNNRVSALRADDGVEVWHLGVPSRRIGTVALPPHEGVTDLTLSPDGRTLTVGTNRGRVWIFAIDGDPTL